MARTNTRKGFYHKILATVFLLSLLLLVTAETAFAYEDIHFELNGSTLFPEGILVSGSKLTVYGIPDNPDYRYMLLILQDSYGREVFRENAPREDTGKIVYSLRNLPVGSFTVCLYHAAVQYSVYQADIQKGLVLTKKPNRCLFLDSPALSINMRQAAGERSDRDALTFYLRPAYGIQSSSPTIKDLSNSLTQNLEGSYSKALAIHDWVCNNIYYDYDVLNNRTGYGDYSALGVLRSRHSVCEGYANLTIALLQAAGIPAKKIYGYAVGVVTGDEWPQGIYDGSSFEPNHAWVKAYIGGHWATLDPTWDSVNSYEYGKVNNNSGLYSYRYFDISPTLFAIDHAVTDNQNVGSLYMYTNYPRIWNGHEWKNIEASPVVYKGSILVPVRVITEEMGGNVHWQKGTDTNRTKVIINIHNHNIQMWINYRKFYVDGKEYTFDIAPQVLNGRIMIPARQVFESIGCRVRWDNNADNWNGRMTIDYLR